MLALGVAFFYATYIGIGSVVAEQSRVQQQSVSPVFDLVRDELLRPFYIAETFANTVDFVATMEAEDFDEATLLSRLQAMEQKLGLSFFVASERTRKQYFSNGNTLDLVEGNVAWYFQAKARDRDFMADLGQVGDVHLFFDVKMRGDNDEFLGYVGVGKRVQQFLESFDRYKAMYGYDFLFVNDNDEIMLSSLPELVVTDAYIPTLDALDWFQHGDDSSASHDSEIIQVNDQDLLVSEFGIKELGWRLLLLSPLEARQSQTTRAFLSNALAALLIVLFFAGGVAALMMLYKRNLENQAQIDLLTGLPNRTYVQRYFNQLKRSGTTLCAIIVDLDRFKEVNDSLGHEAGDLVLQAAATVLAGAAREKDIVGRWGGEEFVMLIATESEDTGRDIAERARKELAALEIPTRESTVSITASFGVAFGDAKAESMAALLAKADDAMYQAKLDGRNLVRVYTPETASIRLVDTA